MANSLQARKRARQGENRRRHNASFKSMVRTYVKKVEAAINDG
ncbi:MAG TPA: 30S ribosomal protein S20, partial [Gammaproteobacteria bacterium]|nr:30S ribosomal protein S20 [Gammaproteobacteria bacterium]